MATSSTDKLIRIIQEGQAQMLDYLKRADERGERQSRATLKALAAIQDGQKVLHEGQKLYMRGRKFSRRCSVTCKRSRAHSRVDARHSRVCA